jgi:hypothetical protein
MPPPSHPDGERHSAKTLLSLNEHLAATAARRKAWEIGENVISREEVVALLFNVTDVARALERIEALIGGEDGEEEETDEG